MADGTEYMPRLADREISASLSSSGAVLIRGPKACGKTFTAQRFAASEVFVETDRRVPGYMDADPSLVLRGEAPRLIDEWQAYPELWNYVRREVDRRRAKGQFILTGSANPAADARIHSGVGRFAIVTMRPMSRAEMGLSTAQAPLSALLDGTRPLDFSAMAAREYSIDDVAAQLVRGGWPELVNASTEDAMRFNRSYVDLTAEVDVHRVDGVKRDPIKVRRLIESYARNIGTQASVSSLARDSRGGDESFTNATANAYIETLERMMVIDELPAWNAHVRSSAALRTTPKRHFTDPSLAIGALRLSVDDLLDDLNFTGLLFESSVVRDLRAYADVIGGAVSFYRDAKGREVDAIVRSGDGSWAGFEIKLGDARIDDGASALLKLVDLLDLDEVGEPASLNVVTSSGLPYRRKDGVNVVPASTLGA